MQHHAAVGHADAIQIAAVPRVIRFHALLFIYADLRNNSTGQKRDHCQQFAEFHCVLHAAVPLIE